MAEQMADNYVNASGLLAVGDGHELYWEDWGNPKAAAVVMHLHGGPGASFNDSHKAIYDPIKHRVIFFDQRGCGQSTPFASTEHNTTQDLTADIERLREHFGLEKVQIAGGSWGSALAMMYAIAHPERVERMLVWSIYLARQADNDWVNAGGPRHQLPEEWARFSGLVPEGERGSGARIMGYYADKMRSDAVDEAQRYAFEWVLWEASLLSINYDSQVVEAEVSADAGTLSLALLETHYFLNGCFVPEGYILDNIATLRRIPMDLVHGRFDLCTPASAAYDLAQAYGEGLKVRWVNSGHRRSDPAMLQELQMLAAEHLG